jgi:hypothetical protein
MSLDIAEGRDFQAHSSQVPKIRIWGALGPIVNYFGPDSILTAQVYDTLRSCQPS